MCWPSGSASNQWQPDHSVDRRLVQPARAGRGHIGCCCSSQCGVGRRACAAGGNVAHAEGQIGFAVAQAELARGPMAGSLYMAARRRHGVLTRCGAAFAGPEAQCARPVNGLRHIGRCGLLEEENATIESLKVGVTTGVQSTARGKEKYLCGRDRRKYRVPWRACGRLAPARRACVPRRGTGWPVAQHARSAAALPASASVVAVCVCVTAFRTIGGSGRPL
eukprot:scaffold20740_cov89-Phaeocystis_antarctica.AAC.2